MKAIKKRPIVVKFWDHCQTTGSALDAKPVLCEAIGYVTKDEPLYLVVTAWVTEDDVTNMNCEHYVVLKSTIVEKRFL